MAKRQIAEKPPARRQVAKKATCAKLQAPSPAAFKRLDALCSSQAGVIRKLGSEVRRLQRLCLNRGINPAKQRAAK
jgi:hypothetical protein